LKACLLFDSFLRLARPAKLNRIGFPLSRFRTHQRILDLYRRMNKELFTIPKAFPLAIYHASILRQGIRIMQGICIVFQNRIARRFKEASELVRTNDGLPHTSSMKHILPACCLLFTTHDREERGVCCKKKVAKDRGFTA